VFTLCVHIYTNWTHTDHYNANIASTNMPTQFQQKLPGTLAWTHNIHNLIFTCMFTLQHFAIKLLSKF